LVDDGARLGKGYLQVIVLDSGQKLSVCCRVVCLIWCVNSPDLSAGNDSRLVVSALKYLSAKNVKCFSYGTQDNSEAKVAKIVAEKLGYEWIFIPLTHCTEKHYYSSSDYAEYLKYSESFASVPYIQGLSALKYLKDIGYVDSDAIFINGNSGDFISGAHISKMMESGKNLSSYEDRKD